MRQYSTGEPIRVRADGDGRPVVFTWNGHTHRVVAVEDVREPRLDWWSPTGEVHRIYYLVTTNRDLICEIYRDVAGGGWHLARLFD